MDYIMKDANDLSIINCHKANTQVVMFSGILKSIKDVKIGDYVMSSDSKAIKVKHIIKGTDKLYIIKDLLSHYMYSVNQNYILSLRFVPCKNIKSYDYKFQINWFDNINICEKSIIFNYNKYTEPFVKMYANAYFNSINENKIVDISIYDFLQLPKPLQKKFEIIRHVVYFRNKPVQMDPYMYGSMDGINIYNMIESKKIYDRYKFNSISIRLEYIAGVIDNFGYIYNNKYKIDVYNDCTYSNDLIYMIRSVGINVSFIESKHIDTSQLNIDDNNENIYTLTLYGARILDIPVKIKKINPNIKDEEKSRIRRNFVIYADHINNNIISDCYGIEFEKNEKYLINNFIVSNSCY